MRDHTERNGRIVRSSSAAGIRAAELRRPDITYIPCTEGFFRANTVNSSYSSVQATYSSIEIRRIGVMSLSLLARPLLPLFFLGNFPPVLTPGYQSLQNAVFASDLYLRHVSRTPFPPGHGEEKLLGLRTADDRVNGVTG